jgi:hypothetical protein
MGRPPAFLEAAVKRMTSELAAVAERRPGHGLGAWSRLAHSLAGAALALLFAHGMAHAATYKWVDEKGVIHYTDKLPPEEVNKANVELNKQGVPVKSTDPAPTAEQRRAKALEDERQKQLAKEQAELARKDRALLSSYTSESEIDLARNRSLRTIESVVQSSKAYSEQLAKRKASIEAKKTTESADKPLPVSLERELEGIKTELAKQEDLLALKLKERVAVNAKYDADKKRWHELIAAKGGEAALLSDVNALPDMTSPATAPPPARKK